MTLQHERLSSRDHQAWAAIFDKLDTLGEEIRSLRLRIAHELGFERCKASALRKGDRVRDHLGSWYTVECVVFAEGAQPPAYRIWFDGAEGFMDIEAQWDGNPWPAMVTRAVEITEEPF